MLSEESISRIDLLYSVAKLNDSALALSDLHVLLRADNTVADLENEFARSPALSSRYQLRSGYVFEKGRDAPVSAEVGKKNRALVNFMAALEVSRRLRGSGSVVIAVSGSTSYESARESDDLDFFCVTENDSTWIFLTRALLLLRASRLSSRRYTSACLSCVMDLKHAQKVFGEEQDALFARDALAAIVLDGGLVYDDLLGRAVWMNGLFPRLYALRTNSYSEPGRESTSASRRLANLFLFHTVGRYIRMKSMIQNRRIEKEGNRGSLFVTKIGDDHCIYESRRYRRMREIYSRINR